MPNFLCLTDPSLRANSHQYEYIDETHKLISQDATIGRSAEEDPLDSHRHGVNTAAKTIYSDSTESSVEDCLSGSLGSIALFVRDESKKSSFALQKGIALVSKVCQSNNGQDNEQKSNKEVPSDVSCDTLGGYEKDSCQNNEHYLSSVSVVAAALITSCSVSSDKFGSGNDDEKYLQNHMLPETFLFGGFEIICNVNTVEVFIVRSQNGSSSAQNGIKDATSNGDALECRITTCSGLPENDSELRELSILDSVPSYVDGTTPRQLASRRCAENTPSYYKFNYVLPGGPKPVEKVRLQFMMKNNESLPHNSCTSEFPVILRHLNINGRLRGRLSDSISATSTNNSAHRQQQQQLTPQHTDSRNHAHQTIPNLHNDEEQASLRSHLRNEMENIQHLDPRHLHIRDQSDIISRIPGVGLFIRPYEELTTSTMKKMMGDLERKILDRMDGIMERLDGLERRLDGIEKCLNIDTEQHSSQSGETEHSERFDEE
jgi:hypothetical protein